MLGDKLRFRFRKAGDLRLLSHHDLMRCLERMLRRATIPFKSTAGFHPTPRLVFALSLPLGVAGLDEVMELELLQPCDSENVLAKLNETAPGGLSFTRVSVVPMKATAVARRAIYSLKLPPDRETEMANRCESLLRIEKIWVNRLRPSPKKLNIRPYIRSVRVAEGSLMIDLWVTGTGTARAEEVLDQLGVKNIVEEGGVLERVTLEIRDEVKTESSGDEPPDGPAESLPLDVAAIAVETANREEKSTATADWGASPNGPVVE